MPAPKLQQYARATAAPAPRPARDPNSSGCYPAQGIIVRLRFVCGSGPATERPCGAAAMHPPLIPGKSCDCCLKAAANGLPDGAYSVLVAPGRILGRPRPCIRHSSSLEQAKTAPYSGRLAQTADLTTRCAALFSSRFTPCDQSCIHPALHTPLPVNHGPESHTATQRLPAQPACSDSSPYGHTAHIRLQAPRTQNQIGDTSVEAHQNTPDHRSSTPYSIPQNPAPTDPREVFDLDRNGCSNSIGLGVRFRRNLQALREPFVRARSFMQMVPLAPGPSTLPFFRIDTLSVEFVAVVRRIMSRPLAAVTVHACGHCG